MSRKGHAEIVCILDRSGSMQTIKTDAIGGFNAFIEDQKKVPGTADVSLILFNDNYTKVYEKKELNEVQLLTEETYIPSGMTALLDAVGRTIDSVGERLSNTKEEDCPEKVLFCILTDGEENSSREYKSDKIKEMITHQRDKYKWEFIFLAANQDVFTTGENLGISRAYTSGFLATEVGTKTAYRHMSKMSSDYRTSQT